MKKIISLLHKLIEYHKNYSYLVTTYERMISIPELQIYILHVLGNLLLETCLLCCNTMIYVRVATVPCTSTHALGTIGNFRMYSNKKTIKHPPNNGSQAGVVGSIVTFVHACMAAPVGQRTAGGTR